MTEREFWIWAKGGLCNKWMAVCAALAVSQRDDRRLVVCWPREAGEERFLTPLGDEGFLSPQASFSDLWSNDWAQTTLECWNKLGKFAVSWLESSGDAARVKARGYSFFCGEHSRPGQDVEGTQASLPQGRLGPAIGLPDSSSDIGKYAAQFVPSEVVQSRIDALAPTLDAAPRTVGLSIRTVRAHPETYKRSPLSGFFDTLAAYFQQFPTAEAFISTDEGEVVQTFIDRFPGHKFHYQEHNSEWHSVESTQKALSDLYLLAHTDCLVGSDYSSFSAMAGVLRTQHSC